VSRSQNAYDDPHPDGDDGPVRGDHGPGPQSLFVPGQAEGTLGAAEYTTKATVTFEAGESEMRTGDYIWRMVYDNTGTLQINRPEEISNQFFLALGVR